ncbi:MAG TPA: DUF1800 family protein [Pyrinomonadaceae bacterium]|jgi:uncharacterized protein (DUF1800 family)
MNRSHIKSLRRTAGILLICVLMFLPAAAQTDPDPNSPTPILLTTPNWTSASIARPASKSASAQSAATSGSLAASSQIVLYVTNVDLMENEGASAFRLSAEDARGARYRFPVVNLRLIDRRNRIYALTAMLKDETGSWEANAAAGGFLFSVTWRGLESNRLRMNFDAAGVTFSGDAGGAQTFPSANQSVDDASAVGYRWSGDRTRFLEQATFGPTRALDDRVRRIGLRVWLAEQFDAPYPTNPYPAFGLKPTTPSPDCNGLIDNGNPDSDPFCYVNHYTMYPVQNWFYKEAFYGDAQLRHRVAWALAQLWVISGVEVQQSSHMTNYYKVLARNAFGNWRQLMQEMTLNPGMGGYLNMRTSTRFAPNENYAREILQLFNIGLFQLNQDGTFKLDGEGNPISTYDQTTVNNFTMTFTGWTLCELSLTQCPSRVAGAPNFIDPMAITNPNNHDLTAKTLLSYPGSTTTNVAACAGCTGTAIATYANNSLNQALDNIYNHPNVAPFVSKFLIQQLVTGDPTPAYVARVAAVFNANRANASQMKEVVRAILLDPEARGNAKTDPTYGKLREPVLLLTNIARHFEARSADRSAPSDGVLTTETGAMGQVVFMAPSVFNFYPPDYVVPGTSFKGPEFALYTTGTAVTRANFANTIIFSRISVNPERRVTAGTSIDLAEMQSFAQADPSGDLLLEMLDLRMMHNIMSPQMRETIRNVIQTIPASDPLLRARRAVYLVATSSQYQVQR